MEQDRTVCAIRTLRSLHHATGRALQEPGQRRGKGQGSYQHDHLLVGK